MQHQKLRQELRPETSPDRSEWQRILIQLIPACVILVAGIGFLWHTGLWYVLLGDKGGPMAQEERVRAPELEGGIEWLNTDAPLSLAGLTGKIVLLDFWTYCCINCLHVIPELQQLEADFPNELVVIGVHSAKFPNEGESENIRQAILRYDIEHPVVNDREFQIWRRYGPRAWPTLVMIDPEGYVVGGISGEGHYETLKHVISQLIDTHRNKGTLNEQPLSFALEKARFETRVLSFPGKVMADPEQDRLFIADSNHNRILITTKTGAVLDVAGAGEEGAADGLFEAATFDHPQGMALDGENVYVADTENHLIRKLDLKARTVTTIAGTGEPSFRESHRGAARSVPLNSPWDVLVENGILYIAMAGPHQIWAMNLEHEEIGPYAGSSKEARIDGPLMEAALAQPSGLASDGTNLFVADSEVSAIRSVSLNPGGNVSTIVGVDLFEFGDQDGQGTDVRLQHPLGVAYHDGLLYVADTYNHKIKQIGPGLRTSVTFLGNGKPGLQDGTGGTHGGAGADAQFYEPSGVSIADDRLYIADTNNHAIRVADLGSKEVTTLQITGVSNGPATQASHVSHIWPNLEELSFPPQVVQAAPTTLTLNVEIPAPFKLNPGSPLEYQVEIDGRETQSGLRTREQDGQFPIEIPLTLSGDETELRIAVGLVYCKDGEDGVCLIKSLRWTVPVETGSDGDEALRIDYTLVPEWPGV